MALVAQTGVHLRPRPAGLQQGEQPKLGLLLQPERRQTTLSGATSCGQAWPLQGPSSGSSSSSRHPHLAGRRHVRAAAGAPFPFDLAWSPNLDTTALAPQLFAASLLPYLVFLGFLTLSGKAPKLTLFGFWFLLVFVGATIPAGIYAKTHYGTALANVDWLHGSAESLLTVTNLLIVLGLRQGIRDAEENRDAEEKKAQQQQQQQQGQEMEQQAPVAQPAERRD